VQQIQITRRGDSAPCPGLLASACACAAPKWCGGNSTHSHHMFTPIIALETSSHLRNNNNGRMMQCAAEYTSWRLSAISGPLASACACAARKWCGDNSTHSHHIVTPIIALETSSHLRNNNNGRMMQCAAEYTSRRLSAISGQLASACACAARKCCGDNSTIDAMCSVTASCTEECRKARCTKETLLYL